MAGEWGAPDAVGWCSSKRRTKRRTRIVVSDDLRKVLTDAEAALILEKLTFEYFQLGLIADGAEHGARGIVDDLSSDAAQP